MPGKRASRTDYGKLSVICTVVFIVLFFVYSSAVHSSPKPPFVPEQWYYSFCLLGFILAIALAVVAGFRESRWWWLATVPPGGCSFFVTVFMVYAVPLGHMTRWT